MATLGRLPRRPMVAVDFSSIDHPEPCAWCQEAWHSERITDEAGEPILREWHQQGCTVVTEWEETDPEALSDSL